MLFGDSLMFGLGADIVSLAVKQEGRVCQSRRKYSVHIDAVNENLYLRIYSTDVVESVKLGLRYSIVTPITIKILGQTKTHLKKRWHRLECVPVDIV